MLLLFCVFCGMLVVVFFFCKQKTAYEMRISDWSSDVCSSDLDEEPTVDPTAVPVGLLAEALDPGLALAQRESAEAAGRLHRGQRGFDFPGPMEGDQRVDVDIADAVAVRAEKGAVDMVDRALDRSEKRRVGKGCVSTCRSRWA